MAGAGSPGGAAAGGVTGSVAGGAGMAGAGGTVGGSVGGTIAGTVGGSPAGGATGASAPNEDGPCEQQVRMAGKTIPDFMIVLDRSGSMRTNYDPNLDCRAENAFLGILPIECRINGIDCAQAQFQKTTACGGTERYGVDRWAPAVDALKSLTEMFQAKVSFGLTIFPGMNGGGGPGPGGQNCAPGDQVVPVGLNTAPAIAMALDGSQPAGFTPTSATLQNVLMQIEAKKADPDAQVPPQYVLLVTDGQPNCVGNNIEDDTAAHQATIAAIDALAMAGVKTYVIGYDASVDPKLANQLMEYAQHGGTNNFYAVQDAQSLVSKFTEITSVVAECSYSLDKDPKDPKFVKVTIDGQQVTLNDPNGFSISGKNVILQGGACDTLRDGSKAHTLSVTVECVPQIIL